MFQLALIKKTCNNWLFPRTCVHCKTFLMEGFFCGECRYLLELDLTRGVVRIDPVLHAWLKKIDWQPLPFQPLLKDLLRLCLEAPRFQEVTTLVVSKKDPLCAFVADLAKEYKWRFSTLEEGAFSYRKTGRRLFVDEVWALIELYSKNRELQLYKIPKKILYMPLFQIC